MRSPSIVLAFRLAASAAAAAMLVQALLGGLALSRRSAALSAHMFTGAVVFALTVVQLVLAILLRSTNGLSRWPLIASALLLLGQILQMESGRYLMLSSHIPLGVELFGLMTVLAYWAWLHWRPPVAPANADTGVSAFEPNLISECRS